MHAFLSHQGLELWAFLFLFVTMIHSQISQQRAAKFTKGWMMWCKHSSCHQDRPVFQNPSSESLTKDWLDSEKSEMDSGQKAHTNVSIKWINISTNYLRSQHYLHTPQHNYNPGRRWIKPQLNGLIKQQFLDKYHMFGRNHT